MSVTKQYHGSDACIEKRLLELRILVRNPYGTLAHIVLVYCRRKRPLRLCKFLFGTSEGFKRVCEAGHIE